MNGDGRKVSLTRCAWNSPPRKYEPGSVAELQHSERFCQLLRSPSWFIFRWNVARDMLRSFAALDTLPFERASAR